MGGRQIDITDHKRLEEEVRRSQDDLEIRVQGRTAELLNAYNTLAENEKLYRNLFENASIGMFQSRLDGRGFLLINKSYATMLGYESPEEVMSLITDTATQIHTDPKNRDELLAALEQNDWYYAEQPYFRKDGSIMMGKLAVRKVLAKDGTSAYLEGIVEDITELKAAEKALKESEKEYRLLLEIAPFPAVITRQEDSRVLYINLRASELFGISPEDAVGLSAFDYYNNPEERSLLVAHMSTYGSVKDHEICLKDVRGRQFWALVSSSFATYNQDKAIFVSFNDITRRKEADKELERKSLNLEEVNTALRVLLQQRERDRIELEDKISMNVKALVLPYIETLKQRHLDDEQKNYLEILESNLKNIVSPFMKNMASLHRNLTGMELKVAHLFREGKTVKEIAKVLGISVSSVNTHRQHIRNKLGLQNQKINLRVYLNSLQ